MSTDAFALMAADVAAIVSGFGSVAVTCGAASTTGLLVRRLDVVADAHGASSQVPEVTLTIAAGALGTPTRNVAVTVSTGPLAGAYRFRQLLDGESDGLSETWLLRKEGA